ncbi:MAG: phosphate acyltransferase PlsX [Bacteroidales bacterium]|jgi:glycerol-3-phosphate acyltransferase PlsX|nr:phosphate acyltransferase PlsX [Bacteroidales bacterium]
MRIGIDGMGGDFAPENVVMGVIQASTVVSSDSTIVVYGDQKKIEAILEREKFSGNNVELVNAPSVIGMGEHPAKAFQQKQDSSITVGFKHLYAGKIDAFASAGSTGAMMVGAVSVIKVIQGIIRPSLVMSVPKLDSDRYTTLLDVGLNSDCKPDVLYQYGLLGSLYAQNYYSIENPRVRLLNIGAEEKKGNLLTQATYALMKESKDFNFCGNIEGHELYSDKADVIVCDGFTGNIVLKQVEAMYGISKKLGIEHKFFEYFNYENHGGTPVLGVEAPIVIGHGASSAKAIKNMVLQTEKLISSQLTAKIKKAFEL